MTETDEPIIKKKVVKDLLISYHIDAKQECLRMSGLYENIEKHNTGIWFSFAK